MVFEFSILDFIQNHLQSGFADAIMPFAADLGKYNLVWLVLGVLLCCRSKTRKCGIAVLFSLMLCVLVCNKILTPFVARVRPCDVNTTVRLLIARPKGGSFPSGGTAGGFAAAAVLMFSRLKGRWAAVVLAFVMAFSQLYLYVHYPTDVLVGAMLGVVCGWFSVQMGVYIKENKTSSSKTKTNGKGEIK